MQVLVTVRYRLEIWAQDELSFTRCRDAVEVVNTIQSLFMESTAISVVQEGLISRTVCPSLRNSAPSSNETSFRCSQHLKSLSLIKTKCAEEAVIDLSEAQR